MAFGKRNLPNAEGEYECRVCKEYKPMWAYGVDSKARNGLKTICKKCLKQVNKEGKLRHLYGLSIGEFEKKLVEQDNKCGCCGDEFEFEGKKSKAPCVDHDHKTLQVRDILCSRCNIALGHIKDCAKRAAKLLEYLLKWGY